MGGMLAVRFTLMFPATVDRLVLVDPLGLEDWKLRVPYVTVDEWLRRELAQTPESVKKYMQESYFGGSWKAAYDPLLAIPTGWLRGPDYPQIAWDSALTYDMIFTQPVLYELGDLTPPTLLIIGRRDRTAIGKDTVDPDVAATLGRYPALARAAAKAIPDATLVEIPNAGHVPQYETPERYLRALTEFLGASQAPAP